MRQTAPQERKQTVDVLNKRPASASAGLTSGSSFTRKVSFGEARRQSTALVPVLMAQTSRGSVVVPKLRLQSNESNLSSSNHIPVRASAAKFSRATSAPAGRPLSRAAAGTAELHHGVQHAWCSSAIPATSPCCVDLPFGQVQERMERWCVSLALHQQAGANLSGSVH